MSRVLSVQSHVVHGYVGNRCATFPLQLLGCEVDVVNTVHFSNHVGYGAFGGQRLGGDDLGELVGLLEQNGLLQYEYIVSGYMGREDCLRKVVDVVQKVKAKDPNSEYVCDPVLGDNGELYVPKELVEVYKTEILPHATLITPNQFEAEQLSERSIKTLQDACDVCDVFHDKGIPQVVISSMVVEECKPGTLTLLASERKKGQDKASRFTIEFEKIDFYFVGTGDLFTALTLAWKRENSLDVAVSRAIGTLNQILQNTVKHQQTLLQTEGKTDLALSKAKRCALGELRIVQSKKEIENPPSTFTAKPLLP
eukprot:TRINITY_DN54489_c0_g1_i1.p1 TRINITY_DN54489_c0_g1~~TRINITY_DN54489_c0_g1_i1.p1  ORF type:complete len:310 (-),score=24.38 TRINITY_DN54489_c0_g1_i1:26-955(-)